MSYTNEVGLYIYSFREEANAMAMECTNILSSYVMNSSLFPVISFNKITCTTALKKVNVCVPSRAKQLLNCF